ncbi:MAG: asparaginase [Actinobacteria bacterium]|nr:asparaginase [Actinomycetota bacterium]
MVETVHDGAVAVVRADGELIAWFGEIDRPFYLRSSAKPFQAMVAQQEGAPLRSVELALASASHERPPVSGASGSSGKWNPGSSF